MAAKLNTHRTETLYSIRNGETVAVTFRDSAAVSAGPLEREEFPSFPNTDFHAPLVMLYIHKLLCR